MSRKNGNPSAKTVLSLSGLALLLTGGLLFAGPLNPPPGAVAPTGKTLVEIEPRIAINSTTTPGDANSLFRITQPGSYYLTGNITGAASKRAIEIAVSDVTIDLNGFTVEGVASSLDGIASDGSATANIIIRNGIVREGGLDGIDLFTVRTVGGQVTDIVASNNGGAGVRVGEAFVISRCSVVRNAAEGLVAVAGASVTSVAARLNTGIGIQAIDRAVVNDCIATENVANGFNLGNASTISNSSADDNGGTGIAVGFLSTISGCSASRNGVGGIDTLSSCTVINNTVSENTGNGIDVPFHCVIRGNTVSLNTLAGIRATNSRTRVEGNNCSGNGTGILITGAGNLIIGNSCSGNTTRNYDIVAGNRYGPIVDATATNAAAATGNSASSTLLSTDANANFAY